MAKLVLLAFVLVLALPASGQKTFYLVGCFDYGLNSGNRYFQQGAVLQNRYQKNPQYKEFNGNLPAVVSLGIHYQISKQVGFESGYEYTQFDFSAHDQKYQQQNNITGLPQPPDYKGIFADRGSFYAANQYKGAFLSGFYFFPTIPAYLSVGLDYNFLAGQPSMAAAYTSPSGEMLQMDLRCRRRFVRPYIETLIGGQNGHSLFCLFVKFSLSGKVVTGNYKDISSGNIVSEDHFSESGNIFSMGIRIGIHDFPKRSVSSVGSAPRYVVPSYSRIRARRRKPYHKVHHNSPRPGRSRNTPIRKSNPDNTRTRHE